MTLPPGAASLAAPLCLNCTFNGIADQHAVGRYRGIGADAVLRWVALCRPCLQIFYGFTKIIEMGDPLTDEETAEFLGVTTDFQVSGDDDDGKEAQGAAPETARILPPASVEPPEPPALFPESNTAAKALEAGGKPSKPRSHVGWSRKPRMSLPEDAGPLDYIRCLEHPERGWLLRGSWVSHINNAHEGMHIHQVPSEPRLEFVCPDENRDGCYASFSTPRGFKRHVTEGHPWAKQSADAAL